MAEISLIAQDSIAAQRTLFERAEKECGLTIKAIHQRYKPLNVSTMTGWKNGAQMPAWALFALGEAGVPDELLSLVSEPFSRFVVTEEDGETDLDQAAADAADFASAVTRARSRTSPGGLAIVPQEKAVIEPKRRKAAASLRRAA